MLFSSTIFLFLFLPCVTFLYFISQNYLKNYILLFSSLLFYAWNEPHYLFIMFLVIGVNYIGSIIIDYFKIKSAKFFAVSLVLLINFFIFGYFKYFDFLLINLNNCIGSSFHIKNIIMPIGISFFIFQSLSYTIDVYRNDVQVQRDIFKLTLYISFFPQLIAGPIIKYHDVYRYIEQRENNITNVIFGLKRFIIGLGKKVLLANTLGEVADKIFNLGSNNISLDIAWLGAICYSLQLYFDFSGYSDMAIGLGRVFGFKFLENFNYPYISRSITEFWRRWHISLSTWFKEYLYIPLGGNRKGPMRTYINLGIVFLATGIWHGANWTFIVWGVWHGLFIILERISGMTNRIDRLSPPQCIFTHIRTMIILIIGWVIFRSDTIMGAINYLMVMFGLKMPEFIPYSIRYYLTNKVILALFVAILASTPILNTMLFKHKYADDSVMQITQNLYLIVVLGLSIMYIAASTYNPFIYFRF